MPWKGIVHSNATVANLIRKAEIRVLPAVIVVDDKVRYHTVRVASFVAAASGMLQTWHLRFAIKRRMQVQEHTDFVARVRGCSFYKSRLFCACGVDANLRGANLRGIMSLVSGRTFDR